MRPVEKTERNAEVVALLEAGERTFQEIADIYGVSRERIRQIGIAHGYDRGHRYPPNRPLQGRRTMCPVCGDSIRYGRLKQHRLAAGHTIHTGSYLTLRHLMVMREFYRKGLGYAAIGQIVGLPPATIKYHIKRAGEPLHPTGRTAGIDRAALKALKAELATRWDRL